MKRGRQLARPGLNERSAGGCDRAQHFMEQGSAQTGLRLVWPRQTMPACCINQQQRPRLWVGDLR